MKWTAQHLAFGLVLAAAPAASAQGKKPLPQGTIAETIDSWIANTEAHAVPAADALPEDKYSFVPPLTVGQYTGVRTFAQQVKHLAANNYWMAALIVGAAPSVDMSQETGPDRCRRRLRL